MARIRSLKPEFGHSEKLSAEHSEVHLLAALLLTYADDEGYFNAHPKLIHAACCPLRELVMSVPEILVRLTAIGYLEMVSGSDGRDYGRITNFLTHQRVTHPTPSKIKTFLSSTDKFVNPPEPFRPEGEREVEEEREVIQEQHPLNHARRIIEMLGLSERIVRSVEAAITAEQKLTGNDLAETAQYIAHRAMEDRAKGIPIDRFYFDDTKWRNGNGKRQASAVEQRVSGNREVLREALRTHVAKRVGSDGDELKDGIGTSAQRRISASAV